MKRIVRTVAAALVAATCMVGFASCSKKDKTFKIGLSGPLTGAAAIYGQGVENSAKMAIEEINAAGGLNGVMFELVSLDDENDATKVETNYSEMVSRGVHATLGCVTTKPALEFKALADEDKMFFMTPSATEDLIPDGKTGFQMCFSNSNQGTAAALYVNESYKGQTIGVLYRSDDVYSTGILNKFKESLDSSIKLTEASFTGDTPTTLESQVAILKDCKFIFMPIYYTPATLFIKQAKGSVAADAVYYGCDGLDGIASAEGFKINDYTQEISMLSQFNSEATEGKAKEFIDKYTTKYGKDTLNQFGASAYDCVYAIYEAMKAAGNKINVDMTYDEICPILAEKLCSSDFTFSGVTGSSIQWDAQGYVHKEATKYIVKAKS